MLFCAFKFKSINSNLKSQNEVILPIFFHSREMYILLFWRCLWGRNAMPSSPCGSEPQGFPWFLGPRGAHGDQGLAGDESRALAAACLCDRAKWVLVSSPCISGHSVPSGVHLSAPGRWPQGFWSWKGEDTHCRGRKAVRVAGG